MAHPLAGKPAPRELLVDVPDLLRRYARRGPGSRATRRSASPSAPRATAARRCGGASTRRTSSPSRRRSPSTAPAPASTGPLFLGRDTHALSEPAERSALEVLAANGVEVVISEGGAPVPTPVDLARHPRPQPRPDARGLADGIVVTPSHNPPEDGGIKYNPPDGGPADTAVTAVDRAPRERAARAAGTASVRRIPLERARAGAERPHARLRAAVRARISASAVDLDAARGAPLRIGVDPLGGSNAHYWGPIAEELRARPHRREPGRRSDVRLHAARPRRQDPDGLLLARTRWRTWSR